MGAAVEVDMGTTGDTRWLTRIDEAAAAVNALGGGRPDVGVVLGSGLGAFADLLEDARRLPFAQVPHFPVSSVVGHAGQVVAGRIGGVRAVVMQGRVHGYEGYDAQEVVFPIRVLCRLGIKALVVTNAAGCVRTDWAAGDLMRISDHLNLSGRNPLVGPNEAGLGPRFPDMSNAYDPRLSAAIEAAAAQTGLSLRAGVYACLLGPSYETPAEIRMLRTLGADAVGMSTVPEVIAAAHMGVPVAGLSCLTNMAAGILDQPLSHAEVTETADRVRDRFVALLAALLPKAVAAVA
jgi:purine-nucleoside phosphorylase